MKKVFFILAVGLLFTAFYPTKIRANVKPAEHRWCGDDINDEWCCADCGDGCFLVFPKK